MFPQRCRTLGHRTPRPPTPRAYDAMPGALSTCIVLALCGFVATRTLTGLEADSAALLDLKSGLTDAASLSGWKAGSDPCRWVGVTCSNGRVAKVYVGGAYALHV